MCRETRLAAWGVHLHLTLLSLEHPRAGTLLDTTRSLSASPCRPPALCSVWRVCPSLLRSRLFSNLAQPHTSHVLGTRPLFSFVSTLLDNVLSWSAMHPVLAYLFPPFVHIFRYTYLPPPLLPQSSLAQPHPRPTPSLFASQGGSLHSYWEIGLGGGGG